MLRIVIGCSSSLSAKHAVIFSYQIEDKLGIGILAIQELILNLISPNILALPEPRPLVAWCTLIFSQRVWNHQGAAS